MKIFISTLILTVTLCSQIQAASMKRVYLDKKQNVHIVTSAGKDLQVTTTGHRTDVRLSSDGETAAWLVKHTWIADGASVPGASELVIYRHRQPLYQMRTVYS
jgi:hypothetical protein